MREITSVEDIKNLFLNAAGNLEFFKNYKKEYRSTVRAVLEAEKDVLHVKQGGHSGGGADLLGWSVFFGRLDIAQDLVDAGALINPPAELCEYAPMEWATRRSTQFPLKNIPKAVKFMLDHGANPNGNGSLYNPHSSSSRCAPLVGLVYFNREKDRAPVVAATKLLLEAGADPNVTSYTMGIQSSPLMIVCRSSPNKKDPYGAALYDMAKLLIDAGADVNQKPPTRSSSSCVASSLHGRLYGIATMIAEHPDFVCDIDTIRSFLTVMGPYAMMVGTAAEVMSKVMKRSAGNVKPEELAAVIEDAPNFYGWKALLEYGVPIRIGKDVWNIVKPKPQDDLTPEQVE